MNIEYNVDLPLGSKCGVCWECREVAKHKIHFKQDEQYLGYSYACDAGALQYEVREEQKEK